MVPIDMFLAAVDAIASEKPSYQPGHDGTGGKCDCIGLIIGAIRRSGSKWNGTHGSNYAARNEMEYLLPIGHAGDLSVGEIVYKASSPGSSNYNLPSRYDGDPDQHDYYHVGVVRSVSPLRIVHCTGPGIVYDTKLGKWSHRGWLKKVSQKGETPMSEIMTATVVADSGSTVRMRATPSTSERLYWEVPVGTVVPVSGRQDGWSRIAYNGRAGWMQDKYLFYAGTAAPSAPQTGDIVTITLPRAVAGQLHSLISAALEGR